MVKVVMAGGGTAGHVNPLLATAAQLRESGAEVVGGRSGASPGTPRRQDRGRDLR